MNLPASRPGTVRDIALIVAVWCACVLIVNPIGDFPILDDWAFGRTVAHLLGTGQYDPLNWGWMTLVTNVLWGALFCLPDGFSFTALRMSTLVAAVMGLIGVYVLFRDLQQPRVVALLAVILTGFNPYFFSLAHSFMTEALFTGLLVWASIFLIRALRTGSNSQLIAGTALALAATLSRQLALCVPLAFAAAQFLKSHPSLQSALRSLIPFVVCAAAYLAVYWAGMIGGDANKVVALAFLDVEKVFRTVISNLYIALVHSGLLLLPILIIDIRHRWQYMADRVTWAALIATLMMALIVAARVHYGGEVLLPLQSYWLVESGVGPVWLYDMVFLDNNSMMPLPKGFWRTITAMALVGSVILVTTLSLRLTELFPRVVRRETMSDPDLVTIFAVVTVAGYFSLLLAVPTLWDRYVVPMVPFLAMAMVGLRASVLSPTFGVTLPWRIVTCVLLALFGLYAVVGTRDYLTWNRVRWTALNELMTTGRIPPDQIDGGFEFNRLYLYDPSDPDADVKLWKRRGVYVVSFGPIPNHSVVKEYSYQHWFPWHKQKILVFRKES